ncbi:toll/interleukin-1 receptor domain-containing protein [Bradyrhizobium sp. URHD0069]|uniref:toll/interleukin-1 receptor domain-containing protein n=1 Tax=Bradyrhizobium sp. URHD0069 TaxID=1380355 RepID=UPI00068ECB68|nr:toll/interleukin-1 receptor domain-containing protein [Bradyrhizobium sp. URHD0069]
MMEDITDTRALPTPAATASPDGAFHYWAFISYSRHDAEAAKKLHSFLETYRIPAALVGRSVAGRKVPSRLMPIFRDRDELPGAGDLPAKLRGALEASGALIVICSPQAAASRWVDQEIREFKMMGRDARVFPLIIDGEPNAGDNPKPGLAECFPRSLRFEVTPDGTITERRSEPLAADARPGMEGWTDACLKLAAGLIDVGFDDLKRRERSRQVRRRLINASIGLCTYLTLMFGYFALADAELSVPGADAIRGKLDEYRWTLFRPVLSNDAMRRAAAEARSRLRPGLLHVATAEASESNRPLTGWSVGQFAGALLRDPDSAPDDLQKVIPRFDRLFRSDSADRPEGYLLLGKSDDTGTVARAEAVLWTLMGLANARARPALLDEARKATFDRYLEVAQRVAELFAPLGDGGWNAVPDQADPAKHFSYTSGLALHMLLELRAANLGWLGSRDRLDRMIADTSAWLARTFVQKGGHFGWRRSLDDDKPPDSGIALMIFSALGRACADARASMPESIRHAALASQIELRRRRYDTADPDIRFDVHVRDDAGGQSMLVTSTRVIWLPWAIEGLVHWKRCALRYDHQPATLRALDRSLGHLLSDVTSEMLDAAAAEQKRLWVLAELAYGLGRAP